MRGLATPGQVLGLRPARQCIFWLCGMAGTGKFIISRTVAQSLAEYRSGVMVEHTVIFVFDILPSAMQTKGRGRIAHYLNRCKTWLHCVEEKALPRVEVARGKAPCPTWTGLARATLGSLDTGRPFSIKRGLPVQGGGGFSVASGQNVHGSQRARVSGQIVSAHCSAFGHIDIEAL
jgi:hypothetical protein